MKKLLLGLVMAAGLASCTAGTKGDFEVQGYTAVKAPWTDGASK